MDVFVHKSCFRRPLESILGATVILQVMRMFGQAGAATRRSFVKMEAAYLAERAMRATAEKAEASKQAGDAAEEQAGRSASVK